MNSTPRPATKLNPTITVTGARHVFKPGLDVDLHSVVTATQCDHSTIKPAQKLTRAQLAAWVQRN